MRNFHIDLFCSDCSGPPKTPLCKNNIFCAVNKLAFSLLLFATKRAEKNMASASDFDNDGSSLNASESVVYSQIYVDPFKTEPEKQNHVCHVAAMTL